MPATDRTTQKKKPPLTRIRKNRKPPANRPVSITVKSVSRRGCWGLGSGCMTGLPGRPSSGNHSCVILQWAVQCCSPKLRGRRHAVMNYRNLAELHRVRAEQSGPRLALRYKRFGLYAGLSWEDYRERAVDC